MATKTRQTLNLFIANGSALASMILLNSLFSRTLEPGAYATYRQLFITQRMIAPFALLGLINSLQLYFSKAKDDAHRQMMGACLTATLLSAFWALCMILGREQIGASFNNPDVAVHLPMFTAYIAACLVGSVVNTGLVIRGRTLFLMGMTVFSTLAKIGIAYWATRDSASVTRALMALAATEPLVLVISVAYLFIRERFAPRLPSWRMLRDYLAFGMQIALARTIGIWSVLVDKVIISNRFSPEVFAVYANGAFEIPITGLLLSSVEAVFIPHLAKGDAQAKRDLWRRVILKTSIFLLPVFCFFFALAEETVTVLFSQRYVESTVYFKIYLLMVPLRVCMSSAVLIGMGKAKLILLSSLLALVANIPCILLFTSLLGPVGATWATIFVAWAITPLQLYFAGRTLDLPWHAILPWRGLSRIFLSAAIALLPVIAYLAWGSAHPDPVRLILSAALYGPSLLAILYRQGLVTISGWRIQIPMPTIPTSP